MHSYQHNIKTFNHATRHLTRVERALYRDLIELYYDTEQPLPADDFERLARLVLANSGDEKAALRYVLGAFFTLTGDVYSHDYCDEQIEKYKETTTQKARAGKASAEARRKKAEQRRNARAAGRKQKTTSAKQPLNKRATNHKPETRNHIDTNPNGSVVNGHTPADCPHQEIIALYNEILPELQRVIPDRWGGARAKTLQARWRESPKHQSLDFWRSFFIELRNWPFYLGENDRGWRPDLAWLLKREKFDGLLEKFTTPRH